MQMVRVQNLEKEREREQKRGQAQGAFWCAARAAGSRFHSGIGTVSAGKCTLDRHFGRAGAARQPPWRSAFARCMDDKVHVMNSWHCSRIRPAILVFNSWPPRLWSRIKAVLKMQAPTTMSTFYFHILVRSKPEHLSSKSFIFAQTPSTDKIQHRHVSPAVELSAVGVLRRSAINERAVHIGRVQLDCQEFVTWTLSLVQWAMAYRQARGCAAPLSPESRPKVQPARAECPTLAVKSAPAARTAHISTNCVTADASDLAHARGHGRAPPYGAQCRQQGRPW